MPPKTKKTGISLVKISAFALGLFLITFFVIKLFGISPSVLGGPRQVVDFITESGLESDNGRTNILLLGIGGEGHEGPNLTDTMIILSAEKHGKDIAMVSIPRDIWVPSLEHKINSAYAFGQEKDKDGLKQAKKTVQDLFGLPIHYGLRMDFSGFERAVDLLGGLNVDVEKSFIDYRYPVAGYEDDACGLEIETRIENGTKNVYFKSASTSAVLLTPENDPFTCRYETIKFDKGSTPMDGITALKYVRSRHGTEEEGTDFARSARQERVILALRKKVLSSETLLNPKRIVDLITTFGTAIDTDISSAEIPHFIKLLSKIDQAAVRRIVLDSDKEDSLLEVPDPALFGGQFVLIPKNNKWQELAEYVQGEIFRPEPQKSNQ